MKLAACLAILIAFAGPTWAQSGPRLDGNWWRSLNRSMQASFVAGYFEGRSLTLLLAPSVICEGVKGGESTSECVRKRELQLRDAIQGGVEGATVGQVVDGIESIYGDYRNRTILISGVITVVGFSISGTPDQKVATMLEQLRGVSSR